MTYLYITYSYLTKQLSQKMLVTAFLTVETILEYPDLLIDINHENTSDGS
jgi:hypothetical protein